MLADVLDPVFFCCCFFLENTDPCQFIGNSVSKAPVTFPFKPTAPKNSFRILCFVVLFEKDLKGSKNYKRKL